MFPNIAKLMIIFMTLPVLNAEAKHSFSALKLLKTYMRSTNGQDCLDGLVLLAVHDIRFE